jgi:hypothetical protein
MRRASGSGRRAVRLLAALLLAACSTGGWAWRRAGDAAPGGDDPQRLAEDVDHCEWFARIADSDDPFGWTTPSARPWGGWGSYPFEFCMHQRGWELRYVEHP